MSGGYGTNPPAFGIHCGGQQKTSILGKGEDLKVVIKEEFGNLSRNLEI